MSSRDERKQWEERYATGARPDRPPSAWVLEAVRGLPNDGLVLDLAGGTGRHAIPLARAGRQVVLADVVHGAVRRAASNEQRLMPVVADAGSLPFRGGTFPIIVVTNFLDREHVTDLVALLAPGGFLVYETYLRAHLDLVQRGEARGPSSVGYLLTPGELPELVRPLVVVAYSEGEVEDASGRRIVARLVARAPGTAASD